MSDDDEAIVLTAAFIRFLPPGMRMQGGTTGSHMINKLRTSTRTTKLLPP